MLTANVECLLSVFYEFEIQNYMNEKQMVFKCLEQFDTKQEKVSEVLFNVYPDEMNALVRLVKKCNKHSVTNRNLAYKVMLRRCGAVNNADGTYTMQEADMKAWFENGDHLKQYTDYDLL